MKRPTWKWRLAQQLEIRWWRSYLQKYDAEIYARQKRSYWQRLLRALAIQPAPQAAVLDAGCGPAGIFLLLDEQRVDAVDPLLDQYTEQLSYFSPTDYPWTIFHSFPIEAYAKSRIYDYVFCLNAINHVSDWEAGLDRITDATAPNGTLTLGIDVHRHARLKRLFRALPGDVLHPHQHDRDDYRAALQKRNFEIIREHTWREGRIFDYWLVVARPFAAK